MGPDSEGTGSGGSTSVIVARLFVKAVSITRVSFERQGLVRS
jgi:hypothetical protein